MEYSEEQRKALYAVAQKLCANNADECEATNGYTEQLNGIDCAISAFMGNQEVIDELMKIRAATEEKISDELNHSHSLLAEYQELVGIMPAED